MMIGDSLFARLAIRNIGALGAEIATLQERVSTGVNDPRPSADPRRATELSTLRDLRARLELRDMVGRNAADRLTLTDQTLATLSDGMRQLKEITLRAANDTLTAEAHAALRAEAITLRETMMAAANATDMGGRALFAGTAPGAAFEATAQGVVYRGNDAASMAQLGETHRIATGLPGSRVFMQGARDIFAVLDDTIAALVEPMLSARPAQSSPSPARLDMVRSRAAQEVGVTLTGPLGAARVTLDLRLDAPGAALAAINAQSARTGITATLEEDGTSLRLTAAGEITVSDQQGGTRSAPVLSLGPVTADGRPAGPLKGLRPAQMGINALVADASRAVDHMATMRAEAGSLAEAVDKRREALAAQRLSVDQAMAQVQDLDVAAALTRLQTLLTTEQAAQMSFVKIVGQSLFNYIR
jgi:flagellar hook-associated protein 3 FlgL